MAIVGRLFRFAVFLVLLVLIYWRHAPNIARLLKGEEPRIGAKKTPAPS